MEQIMNATYMNSVRLCLAKVCEETKLPWPEEPCVLLDGDEPCKECVFVEDLLDALVEDLLDVPFEDLFERELEWVEDISVSEFECWAIPMTGRFNLTTLPLCPRTRIQSAFTTIRRRLYSSRTIQSPIVQKDECLLLRKISAPLLTTSTSFGVWKLQFATTCITFDLQT